MKEYKVLKSVCKYLIEKKPSIIHDSTKYIMGAFALDESGTIISKGCNSFVKTHPRQKELADQVGLYHKIFLHAEIAALVKAHKKVDTLIVVRIRQSDNTIAMAKPCPVCTEAIKQAGVRKVYFTDDSGKLVLLNLEKEVRHHE